MKKLALFVLLIVVSVYGIGRFQLGESGATRFLAKMDSLMTAGEGQEVCEMFHDDLEMEIIDHSSELLEKVSGGKQEFCDLAVATAANLNLLPNSMSVNFTEVRAKWQWLHPWTSEISYLENRSLSILGSNVTLRTVSHDEITLVHTFSGVKLRKLRSEVYKADAT